MLHFYVLVVVCLCRGDDFSLAAEAARSLQFSRQLVELADNVVHRVTDGGRRQFNGLHLRLEDDLRDWIARSGGVQVRCERVESVGIVVDKRRKRCKIAE